MAQTFGAVPGFCSVRVKCDIDPTPLEDQGLATLGIIVDDGTDRGQTLACACSPAEVATWSTRS
jgi:hypothetical protein